MPLHRGILLTLLTTQSNHSTVTSKQGQDLDGNRGPSLVSSKGETDTSKTSKVTVGNAKTATRSGTDIDSILNNYQDVFNESSVGCLTGYEVMSTTIHKLHKY